MLWAKFDCQSPSNPKLVRAGAEAAWLWHASICYSNLHHLDGKIEKDLLSVLYQPLAKQAPKLAKKLVALSLWHDRGDHYEIHDYSQFQAAALKAEQEAKREAQQEYERERKESWREAKAANAEQGGKVYFVRVEDRIKIGFSKNPWARLEALKTVSPKPPQLVGYMKGSMQDEQDLHARFSHLRENGEWFVVAPELLDFIATVAPVPSATVVPTTVATEAQTTDLTTPRAGARDHARVHASVGSVSSASESQSGSEKPTPWLFVWKEFERITGDMQGSHAEFYEPLQTIASVCQARADKHSDSFAAVVERCLRAWLADEWVVRTTPSLRHLAANLRKYVDAPAASVSTTPYHKAVVL